MELLRDCIEGDADARRRLVEDYSGIVSYGVSVIFQQFGRPSRREEIEDLCQDVFLSLHHPGGQVEEADQEDGQPGQAHHRRRRLPEHPLKEAGNAVRRHGMRHERLKVIGNREPL